MSLLREKRRTYDVLFKNNKAYTQNENGIFFNLKKLDDNTLIDIDNIIKEYES